MIKEIHYPFDMPIFTSQIFDFQEKKKTDSPLLILGGGGGASKTGVKNKLKVLELNNNLGNESHTYDFGGCTPTALSLHGNLLACVTDNFCTILEIQRDEEALCKFEPLRRMFPIKDQDTPTTDKYSLIKAVAFSPDYEGSTMLAFGIANGFLSVYSSAPHFDRLEHYLKPSESETATTANPPITFIDWNPSKPIILLVTDTVLTFVSFESEKPKRVHCSYFKDQKDANYKLHACKWIDEAHVVVSYILPRKKSFLGMVKFDREKNTVEIVSSSFVVFRDQHHTCMKLDSSKRFAALGSAKGTVSVVRVNDPKKGSWSAFKIVMSPPLHSFCVSDLQFIAPKSSSSLVADDVSKLQMQIVSCSLDGTLCVKTVEHKSSFLPLACLLVLILGLLIAFFWPTF